MNIQFPPVLFYGIGALLIVFGALRAYQLGWQRRREKTAEVADEPRTRGPQPRYHLMVGLVWVAMGLFLVISTLMANRR